MMYDWLNVGSQKKKMGGSGICPCCGIEEEDQLHILLHQRENAKNSKTTLHQKVHNWLKRDWPRQSTQPSSTVYGKQCSNLHYLHMKLMIVGGSTPEMSIFI
jgi:hypothetical protein